MSTATAEKLNVSPDDLAKIELYAKSAEGLKDIEDGNVSSIEDVKARIHNRRAQRG